MDEGASDAVFSDKCETCDENCKTCFLESYRCQSCHEGFRLSTSNRCIGDFTVNMNITFDIDYQDFQNNLMSEDLINLVANYLGLDAEEIDILKLLSGSTDASLSASATS